MTITDREGTIRYVNEAFTTLTGYTRAEVLGETPRVLRSGEHSASFFHDLWGCLLAGQVWSGDIVNRKKNGERYVDGQTITPILDANGEVGCFISVRRDVTKQRELEDDRIQAAEEAWLPRHIDQVVIQSQDRRALLSGALTTLMQLHEFQAHSRGVAFDVAPDASHLRLLATHGAFSSEFLRDEAVVPMGSCLCGLTAQTGQVLVCVNCYQDERHIYKWLGMKVHGHYTIPLRTQSATLGVINLYTDVGVNRSERRVAFLASIGFRLGAALARLPHDTVMPS